MNINQPPPGIPDDPHSGPVHLISESVSEVTGESIRTELYSDGSRKLYKGGKLFDEQRVFTDEEKALGAMRPDFMAEPVAGAAADEPEHALEDEEPVEEEPVEEEPAEEVIVPDMPETFPDPTPAKPVKKPAARKKA